MTFDEFWKRSSEFTNAKDLAKAAFEAGAVHERKACAKVCRDMVDKEWPNDDISLQAKACAASIMARGHIAEGAMS